ncbi:hypothetical protein AWM68_17460 [Fictibacillus phosphorivorans]|uniref:Uncharacterized protein n=1 Tax=Fictibacillus phosphorivorans TaxID=1221500 RepID=A0A165NWH9_9BACL|nr:hypothetical protein [Fictibacillus phosphorivorans]KZE67960.1 hypothetical protein AWM68_17460 [Fictibacillus phosphorivorans]
MNKKFVLACALSFGIIGAVGNSPLEVNAAYAKNEAQVFSDLLISKNMYLGSLGDSIKNDYKAIKDKQYSDLQLEYKKLDLKLEKIKKNYEEAKQIDRKTADAKYQSQVKEWTKEKDMVTAAAKSKSETITRELQNKENSLKQMEKVQYQKVDEFRKQMEKSKGTEEYKVALAMLGVAKDFKNLTAILEYQSALYTIDNDQLQLKNEKNMKIIDLDIEQLKNRNPESYKTKVAGIEKNYLGQLNSLDRKKTEATELYNGKKKVNERDFAEGTKYFNDLLNDAKKTSIKK